jgi:ubiquitin carboxyl-terminal hydrolase 22/27/51
MNSVLQAIVHNPLLKAYFLEGKHSNQLCTKETKTCMACQIDILFEKFVSNDKMPITPHNILYCMWLSQKHMASYAQQDAHEFFIAFVDEIHKNCSSQSSQSLECPCVVHKVFGGLLQSEVTCSQCNNCTCTDDPFLDLSLEVKKGKKKKVGIVECLEDYTLGEKLLEYNCKQCNSKQEASKQLSIKQLPPVLCIQLKRFEHNGSSQKIKFDVKVPFFIDMTPFTSRHFSRRKKKYDSCNDGVPMFYYNLYAAVCHVGDMDNGHYKAYVKVGEDWLLFDDAKVTKAVKLDFSTEGYLLFYQKCFIDYVSEHYQ